MTTRKRVSRERKAGNVCHKCAHEIEIGQAISWARRGPRKGEHFHKDCVDPWIDSAPAAPEPVASPEPPEEAPPTPAPKTVEQAILGAPTTAAVETPAPLPPSSRVDTVVETLSSAVLAIMSRQDADAKNLLRSAVSTIEAGRSASIDAAQVKSIVRLEVKKMFNAFLTEMEEEQSHD